jgi:hypothetical protein
MLNKCQLVMATGGTVAQDLTMQWSTLMGFMQDLSVMIIDEGQQSAPTVRLPPSACSNSNHLSFGQAMHNRPLEEPSNLAEAILNY